MGTNRRHFSDEFKAKVVERHLADKVLVSDLTAEHEIQPSLVRSWVKQVLDRAAEAFERSRDPRRLQMVDHAEK